ncbi:MAG: peptidoglycan-binding protein [Burkholderiales bacterium]|nr:peptidoglycan-binding protein [Burkholderiales bacterium]
MGALTRLIITQCKVDKTGKVTIENKKFEAMLNPSSYNHTYSIRYNRKKALGQLASDQKFSNVEPEKVNFDLVLDGSGLVDMTNGAKDVKTQIQKLNDIIYKYDGNVHQPNHVRLLWGSFIFFGRMSSLSVDYTLFTPTGQPLRAKVKIAFDGFVSKEEEALVANRSSPDLTHLVEVKAGDTLPILCHRIYGDSAYYLSVARINGITNFRNIRPGTRLHFPPLR